MKKQKPGGHRHVTRGQYCLKQTGFMVLWCVCVSVEQEEKESLYCMAVCSGMSFIHVSNAPPL